MVELLLTLVFVMLGVQMIQGSFLRAADVFGRYSNTLKVMTWADESLAHAREALLKNEFAGSEDGVLHVPNKDFTWQQSIMLLDGSNLYSIALKVSWTEGGKPLDFEKQIYVYKKDLSQGL